MSVEEHITALEKESVALEKQLQEQPTPAGGELDNRLGSLIAKLIHCENLFTNLHRRLYHRQLHQ